jgi:PAS domain S-box-containing protein
MAIETGEVQRPFDLELVHKNGKRVWVEVRQVPVVENGITTSVVGAMIDITEHKKINEQLQANKKGFRNLIDESPTPIAINNKKGDIEYLNYEFTKTFGYTLNDIPHTDQWFALAYPDEKYREEIKRLWMIDLARRLKHKAPKTPFEVRITCKDGSTKFVQIMWSYIGEKLVLIFYDLTKHKKLEEQIRHKNDELENALNELKKINKELEKATQKAKESDRLKSAFLANMSHEIRTPMNSIIGFSSLLSLPGTTIEKREKYTDFIQKSGKHLLRIIDDIIDVAKIESNQLKISKSFFSIVPFLENTYDYYRQSSMLKDNPEVDFILDHQLAKETIILFTDPIRLKQVFDNMLTNSIKNTSKGSIKFGIRKIEENHLTFYVADTGTGIPEKFKKSIFMRFTRAETRTIKPGTGLGLSIIKGITGLLGGEIWFDSTENVGTTFYVKIPIQPEE